MTDIVLTREQFAAVLAGLAERDDRLVRLAPGERRGPDEVVDSYVLSAYLEALRSEEIDGDVWGTLEDLELTAPTEDEAWAAIKDFYLSRACLLLRVEADEYVIAEELARRIGLTDIQP